MQAHSPYAPLPNRQHGTCNSCEFRAPLCLPLLLEETRHYQAADYSNSHGFVVGFVERLTGTCLLPASALATVAAIDAQTHQRAARATPPLRNLNCYFHNSPDSYLSKS